MQVVGVILLVVGGAILVAVGLALLLVVVAAAAVLGFAVTGLVTVGYGVFYVCRGWVSALRDDERGHLHVAPPDVLPPGRDPGYRSYYFGPAWRDYAFAARRGAAKARDRTVRGDDPATRSVLELLVDLWHVPDHWDIGPSLIGKVVAGGAVLGGLAGLAVGGIEAGVFLAVTTATFALLLGVVVGGILLVCGVLRGVELGLLRLRGITVECPSCHRRVGVPTYECPSCQELHRRLVPGSLGVLARTCRCGARLPTLLVTGRSKLRAHCGYDSCQGVLPLGGLTVPTRHIPVVAGRVAGKTVHTMAAIADLRAHSDEAGLELADEHTTETFRLVEEQLRDVSSVPATLPTASLRAATFFLGVGQRRRLVYLYDAAGERYQSSDRVSGLRFLGVVAGVLLVVDPFALVPVRQQMEAGGVALPPHSTEDPGVVAGRFTAGLREHGAAMAGDRISVPCAVVLTKCDVLVGGGPVRHPYDDAALAEVDGAGARGARSQAVRRWLNADAGEGGLVRQLATDYARVSYFAVSALDAFGTDERPSPRTQVLVHNDAPSAPLRWLLDGDAEPV
jgi:Double-GTPase 2